jgi:hypothetical protein
MSGVFSRWQPEYAARGIATFPVKIEPDRKVPMVRGYHRVGLRASTQLAQKFSDANALGCVLSPRNGMMLVDVDTKDPAAIEVCESQHGKTPIVTQTASKGGYHCWYRHSEEAWRHYKSSRREVRPDHSKPFDYLSAGLIVLPPSLAPLGAYQFIRGGPDDVASLPVFAGVVPARHNVTAPVSVAEPMVEGSRNTLVWRQAMRWAKSAASFDRLLELTMALNQQCIPPMNDAEVIGITKKAWAKQQAGQNRFGQHGAYFDSIEVLGMLQDQDAFILLAFLRSQQGPWSTFMVANGLMEKFGWPRKRLAAARSRLIEMGYIKAVRHAGDGTAALYKWVE